jgi:hypothetical protein
MWSDQLVYRTSPPVDKSQIIDKDITVPMPQMCPWSRRKTFDTCAAEQVLIANINDYGIKYIYRNVGRPQQKRSKKTLLALRVSNFEFHKPVPNFWTYHFNENRKQSVKFLNSMVQYTNNFINFVWPSWLNKITCILFFSFLKMQSLIVCLVTGECEICNL